MKREFSAAGNTSDTDILAAIRAPEKSYSLALYMTYRPKDVANGLLKLAEDGETDVVTSFLSSDARRFDSLTGKNQLETLVGVLNLLAQAQQFEVISSVESESYGAPNATVFQHLVSSKKGSPINDAFIKIVNSFDIKQQAQLFCAPGAVWWAGSYDQDDLMEKIFSNFSQKQLQRIYNGPEVVHALELTGNDRLIGLFKDCKMPKPDVAPKRD